MADVLFSTADNIVAADMARLMINIQYRIADVLLSPPKGYDAQSKE